MILKIMVIILGGLYVSWIVTYIRSKIRYRPTMTSRPLGPQYTEAKRVIDEFTKAMRESDE